MAQWRHHNSLYVFVLLLVVGQLALGVSPRVAWGQAAEESLFLPLISGLESGATPDENPPENPPAPPEPQDGAEPRINAPLLGDGIGLEQAAIAWFGRVDATSNYADVRVHFKEAALHVAVQVFDKKLWYDTTPAAEEFTNWDAVSLFLELTGNTGAAPAETSYQFVAQLNHAQDRTNFQAAYQGNGETWDSAAVAFSTVTGWRGSGLNNGADARGWTVRFEIPYATLGLVGHPPANTVWGMGVVVHDRDTADGTPMPEQTWPAQMDPLRPATWGQVAFGTPSYTPPTVPEKGVTTIRHGLNGATVVDAHVGGHTNCGQSVAPDYFGRWGDANYAGYTQVNVQSQWDVADFPCFSKFYVTFPLTAVPTNHTIISATLTLHLFGNAGQGDYQPEPRPSLIQVLTVASDWTESTITWNNAPLAAENVSAAWVAPVSPGQPDVPYTWDVSAAVADAYGKGEPLRLVLYMADTPQHTGKYFWSSDVPAWNEAHRPTLSVTWGDPAP